MEEKLVNLTIDNIPVTVPAGTTVLEAARSAGKIGRASCRERV